MLNVDINPLADGVKKIRWAVTLSSGSSAAFAKIADDSVHKKSVVFNNIIEEIFSSCSITIPDDREVCISDNQETMTYVVPDKPRKSTPFWVDREIYITAKATAMHLNVPLSHLVEAIIQFAEDYCEFTDCDIDEDSVWARIIAKKREMEGLA